MIDWPAVKRPSFAKIIFGRLNCQDDFHGQDSRRKTKHTSSRQREDMSSASSGICFEGETSCYHRVQPKTRRRRNTSSIGTSNLYLVRCNPGWDVIIGQRSASWSQEEGHNFWLQTCLSWRSIESVSIPRNWIYNCRQKGSWWPQVSCICKIRHWRLPWHPRCSSFFSSWRFKTRSPKRRPWRQPKGRSRTLPRTEIGWPRRSQEPTLQTSRQEVSMNIIQLQFII